MIPHLPDFLRAVIFDFDGVIGDTMPDNFHAWQHAFKDHGITIEAQAYFPLEGMGPESVAATLCRRYEVPITLAPAIAEKKERYYLSEYEVRVFPGVRELLRHLRNANIRTALVTGASRQRLSASLQQDIQDAFACIVTSDDVEATKPDPEPYRKAVTMLAIGISAAIAVENAPFGITSAKRAGLFCVALCTTLAPDALHEADLILQTHADLLSFFSRYTVDTHRGKP